uniref:HDC12125 n=1 Tax=Drosophila melanogaster TaxID=7227 RepID=Q6IKM2_DROME|nr:TPA_inf: HDC12125 [Drosophila melanogaster]
MPLPMQMQMTPLLSIGGSCACPSVGRVKQLGNKSVSWIRLRDGHILTVDRVKTLKLPKSPFNFNLRVLEQVEMQIRQPACLSFWRSSSHMVVLCEGDADGPTSCQPEGDPEPRCHCPFLPTASFGPSRSSCTCCQLIVCTEFFPAPMSSVTFI